MTSATTVRVTADKLARKTLELSTVQPASIQAFEEAPLFSKISGYVGQWSADIGDRVKKDQVLVKLWVPEMENDVQQKEALVAQTQAELRQAEAAVRAAEAGLVTAQARVHQAEAGVTRAEAGYARAASERTRISNLAAQGSVTEQLADETLNQFRAAEAARQEAAAAVESAKAGLVQGQADVEKATADQGTAEARVRVAQAELARSKTLLAYAEVHAPFDGVITRRYVDTGHYVQPSIGGQPLVTVTRGDVVRVFVDVPEMEAALVNEGDTARITVQAVGGREVSGKVTRTSWSLDPVNRSLRTEIDLANADGLLRPGMYATVAILLERRQNALALPATAVVRDGANTFCYTIVNGRTVRTPVVLGLHSGDQYEVVSGLRGDETVVLLHPESLQDGQPVEHLPPEPAK